MSLKRANQQKKQVIITNDNIEDISNININRKKHKSTDSNYMCIQFYHSLQFCFTEKNLVSYIYCCLTHLTVTKSGL